MDTTKQYECFVATCELESGKIRPDKYLSELFPDLNRSQIQRAATAGSIRVNGKQMAKKQQFFSGDEVEVKIEKERSLIPYAVSIPLDIVYEDSDIIVINKAPGMVTHPGSGTGDNTLVHALLHHCDGKLSVLNGPDRPGIVHRLDKETSGVIVAAKSDAALLKLLEDFKGRDIDKYYLALCCGSPATVSGTLTDHIGRHSTQRLKMAVVADGKPARTDWKMIASHNGISLIECKIYTGRTHQIRVHMSHLGHPIVGDSQYGYQCNRHPKVLLKADRPLLHAWKIRFNHPISGLEMSFEIPPRDDFDPWTRILGMTPAP